jgi:glutathione gamma-glutamylcysteinyltransferase
VLILDVARFKVSTVSPALRTKTRQYPSHWIDIDLLHQALLPIDKATGQPRGYVILSVAVDPPSSTLFKVAYNKQSWKVLIRDLKTLSFSGSLKGDLQSLLNKISPSPIKVREVPPVLAPDAVKELAKWRSALQPLHAALKVDTSDEQLLFLLALLRSHVIPKKS